ncbi:MAG: hypothetical protein H7644_13455 [Candidatus Heimdallarchaeota archaeon]|nr:hypothetical protein [Candidatus Heimdallarchaeota archaeon]MCK5144767.1 hypothetical protein [Candidatus Heimdallarchaeota archaeon]
MEKKHKLKHYIKKVFTGFLRTLKYIVSIRKSTKSAFLMIISGIISITMIIVTILGALVWTSGLATVAWGFIAIISGLTCIITIAMIC